MTGAVLSAELAPDIHATARVQGEVRVIVHLHVTDGTGPAAIAAAQDAALAELTSTAHRMTRRYTTIPLMALSVSEAALRVLAVSSNVVSVQEDRQRR
jgi:hypothetical protein